MYTDLGMFFFLLKEGVSALIQVLLSAFLLTADTPSASQRVDESPVRYGLLLLAIVRSGDSKLLTVSCLMQHSAQCLALGKCSVNISSCYDWVVSLKVFTVSLLS